MRPEARAPVGHVHQWDRQGAATLGPLHRDEANVVASESVEKAAAGQPTQKHLQAREGLDYPTRRGRAGAR
jgi:hypothetical protein